MGELGSTIGGVMKSFSGPAAPEPQPLQQGGGGSAYQPSATAMGGETPLSQAKGMLASSGGIMTDVIPSGGAPSAAPAAVPRVSDVLSSGATAQAFGAKPDPMVPGTGMLPSYTQAPGGVAPGTGALDNPNILPDQKTGRGLNWDDLKTGLNIANATSQTARGLYGDLSRGPGASPLMAPRAGAAGAYQPTARKKPLRLSDIMGRG